ncbi:uncharacterized protein LOC122403673 [Colletes gigas]|uniref:uncharacterized protein LOC122403673 n=1 Tax=Colletes gigas TaxID=935657 RepID=UPI001C9BAFA8|nr:uncharacterized protein LOC122403673 [Colletes gigas]
MPADKGNATVVMYRKDYNSKIQDLLHTSTYTKINKDPTPGISRITNQFIKQANLSLEISKSITSTEPQPPKLYGLPKIHKDNIPLRPIVSAINSPTHNLAKYLCRVLQPLTEHCLTSTYFTYQGEFYRQETGAAMGSPISPVVADIFMVHLEKTILENAPAKPTAWFRYVDDTFVIWRHGREALNSFHNFINSIHPSIKFTVEIEKNQQIPFLDVLVNRKHDGTLGHKAYRKPTHTDRYLQASSHHHPSQKVSVISSLITRAVSISEPSSLQQELTNVKTALIKNGYTTPQINRTMRKIINTPVNTNTQSPPSQNTLTSIAFLPYLQGITDRISRVLKKYNIKTIFQPAQKSAVAEHQIETGHKILFQDVKVLAKEKAYFPREYREAVEIRKNPEQHQSG